MSEQENTPEEAPTQTLEELASQFKSPEKPPLQSETATQSPKFEGQPEDFQPWAINQIAAVTGKLNQTTQELEQRNAQELIAAQDKVIGDAVSHIQGEVEIEQDIIEGQLHLKYSKDENFAKIWDNRDQNKAAFKAALNVIASELKAKSQWQPDPEGAENAQALKELQKTANRASSKPDDNDRFRNMSDAEFSREWEKMRAGA